jgi:hypothetical protein
MSINSGYLVKTKGGKEGRTYHREGLVSAEGMTGKKMIVHLDVEGKDIKMLCDPKTVEIIGFVD